MAEMMQFQDGERYETMMGIWSSLVGTPFLTWLGVPPGAKWLDVGCGNGASTELIANLTKPAAIEAIDPSEPQLAFARERRQWGMANFTLGSAQQLPYPDGAFDAAMMALVIFFVPDPAKGVAEMVRVVRPGGTVAAYAWDIEGGGFPYEDVHVAMRDVGIAPILPPRSEIARLDALQNLWTSAGLHQVETRAISAKRTFPTFETYWSTATSAPGIAPGLSRLSTEQRDQVRNTVQKSRGSGAVTAEGRAHAVRGLVKG